MTDRRAFLRIAVAVSALASGFRALGQTLSAPSSVLVSRAGTWRPVPNVSFVQGVPARFPVASFVSGDVPITLAGSLPPGVTYDPIAKEFVYDGKGGIGATSGVVLVATVPG